MNNYELRVEYVEYVVKKGDSLYSISKMYDTSVTELIDINMLTSNTLFPGQVLLVPKKTSNNGYDYYTYSTIENDISKEMLAQHYNETMRNAYMGDKLNGIIPCMGIFEFLDKLKEVEE